MLYLLYSPLEQFDLMYFSVLCNIDFINSFSMLSVEVESIDVVFLNIMFIFVLLLLFYYLIVKFILKKKLLVNINIILIKYIYLFIMEIILQQLSENEIKYFPLFFSIFIFVLFANLFGMLPFGFTITAHLSITFFIAFTINISLILIGFIKHQFNFLKLFIPSGTPSFLLPLIIVIEVVSYLIRTFSLSIRLFANMMAGHCLIFVISSFVSSLFYKSLFLSIVPLLIIFFGIFILEFAICFLQAYVFIILICIYLNDSLHPSH